MQLLNTLLSGLTLGAVFAAFALALVLIWRSTRIVNFAQAPMAMITTLLASSCSTPAGPTGSRSSSPLLAGLVLGAVVEFALIRRVDHASEINPVILTLGLFVVLHAAAAIIFSSQFRSFPSPFSVRGLSIGGTTFGLTPTGIFILVAVGITMALLTALFRFTDLGLKMRASAFNQEVAKLLGVRVGSMLTLGWALAAVVGSLSGLLIGSGALVHPGYMDAVVVYGFVAAVLGGLDSPVGAVVGGVLLGLSLSLVSGYVGSQVVPLAALVILMLVLTLKPAGLFAQAQARRV